MINKESFQKFEEDDRYVFYRPIHPIKIFAYELDSLDCEVSISKNLCWEEIIPLLIQYLEWLSSCKTEVTRYFRSISGEDLADDWFENIEVYHASITFAATEDYGATIEFGETVLCDHIVIFDFEKFEITADRLNG